MYKVQHITNQRKIIRDMKPEYLTIHSTGNLKSTAQNERDNLNRTTNTSTTGFHIIVDELQAIECIPLNKVAYHAGDGANGPGNSRSIGLEICESGNRIKTIENAVEVIAKTLHERSWGIDKLKRHFDWSGKNCPSILNYDNWKGWAELKTKVQAHLNLLNYTNIETNKLYRVQVGAYSIKANAEKLLNDLKLAGFNGIIKEEDIKLEVIPEVVEFDYYEKYGLKVIETYAKNIYVATLPGKTLREFGIFGINGTWQNNPDAADSKSIWGLAANKLGPIGPNSYQNSPNGHKRGTLICYADNNMAVKQINHIDEIKEPINWVIGGGSLVPYYDPTGERIASDILRLTHHTAIGYKKDRVFLIISDTQCTMGTFRQRILNLKLDGAVFLDGGGSTQMNWKDGQGLHQSRKLSHGVFVKGVK